MGCDIHMYAEVQNSEGKWEKVGKVFKNPYYRPGEPNQIDEEDGYEWNPEFIDRPYRRRNYNLFGILADVRNGIGFAGINTGAGFVPISQPKGLPEDVSKEILLAEASFVDEDHSLEMLKGWVDSGYSVWIEEGVSCTCPDAHSESYFTVQELLDYDWNQFTMERGYVTLKEYKELMESENKVPNSWCGGIDGPSIVKISESDANEILSRTTEDFDNNTYVDYSWVSYYRDSARGFLEETMPVLQSLGEPDKVRIVFWFDN